MRLLQIFVSSSPESFVDADIALLFPQYKRVTDCLSAIGTSCSAVGTNCATVHTLKAAGY